MEEGYYNPDHFVINIPTQYKTGLVLPLNRLGTYSFISHKSFESIENQIQKIHLIYRPFIWILSDPYNQGIFTVTTLGMSYKIYIYSDIESDTYIVELVNINMPNHVISSIFDKLCGVL